MSRRPAANVTYASTLKENALKSFACGMFGESALARGGDENTQKH